MSPPSPLDGITLDGYARMRGVTLALPIPTVGRMLPAQLALGPQDLTPAGTHPVTLLFYDVIEARMSFPSPLPPLTYREHIVAIPYTLATCGDPRCDGHGPLVYMPTLRLDNAFAVNGGVALWGFAKRLADIVETTTAYDVHDRDGGRISSFEYAPDGGYRPPEAFAHFAKLRAALDQPVVSRFGVHLIQLTERRESQLSPREQREIVRGLVREKKMEEAYLTWAQDVRARAYVEFREPPQ